MFKVPDWEDDTSKSNLSFPKKAKFNNKRKKNLLDAPKLRGVIKPKLKDKSNLNQNIKLENDKLNLVKKNSAKQSQNNKNTGHKKIIQNTKKHSPKTAKVTKKQKIQGEANNRESIEDNKIDEKLYDTDKLDEIILNEKKQKLNSYKIDDIEEILFNDNSENIKTKTPELENNQSGNKIVETREDKKKKAPKSILQNRNGNNSVTKKLHNLENQISKPKDERKKKMKKFLSLQNGNKNNLENEKTKKGQKLNSQILKTKSNLLQNGNKNELENHETNEMLELENHNLKTKEERRKKVQKPILMNGAKITSEKKISKETNTLSGGNKIIKIKDEKKKEALKTILQSENHRNSINVSGNKLRERMLERLKAAQFRYLNEKLYTSSGSDAKQLFQEDPEAFQTYHEGYQQQVKRWPVKPLDVIVKRIQKMPKTHTIADMGCGEAELSTSVVQPVRSFDLVASKPGVESCDMAHTPLLSCSMDVAVYCLALMGTDLTQYLIEANRVLKVGGHLLIAEVESRFHDVDSFTRDVQKLGFNLKKVDKSQKVFFFMEFTKVREPPVKKAKLPVLSLKPCIYKKR